MKKVRFAEHTTVHVSPVISTSHSVCTCCAWWIIIVISIVTNNPPLLNMCDLMTVTSALVQRVECLLDRFERERVAVKSNDPLLSRIAGWVPDEQFLEVADLDGPARCRVAYDLLKLGQNQNDVHIARTFCQPKTAVAPSRMGLTPGLLFDMSRSCWDRMFRRTLNVCVNTCEPNDQCS